jgi:cation diffusion facilitator CzcD-associated flavoprotein CzcO
MTMVDTDEATRVEAVFDDWVSTLGAALETGDPSAVVALFSADGYWKDILSFTWAYRTFAGPAEIEAAMAATLPDVGVRHVRPARDRTAPRLVRRSARDVIEGYFDFTTALGTGTGFVRLLAPRAGEQPLVWIMLTTLQELKGFEERSGKRRPTGEEYSHNFGGDNWLDLRRRDQDFSDRDPEVLVVGGGQSGLILGARLRQLGVDALIVEKTPQVGDTWRNRYHSLTLHNEVWANSLPYMPFPPTWPTFLPKDKLAGWLEAYAEFMELNVWTGTEFLSASYDAASASWSAQVRRADGEIRNLRVPHLVLATGGVSDVPRIPNLPGLDEFAGTVIHSSRFSSGLEYAGKRALVIGTGNSGHDVAQDLYSNGAERVTIVQHSPTCVVSLVPSGTLVYSVYSEGPPVDDVDLITAAIPYPVLRETYQWLTKRTTEMDKDLLDRLNAVGFETTPGPDGTGFHMMYLRKGGGYYINVGCSDLIADRKIDLLQARDIQSFTSTGVSLRNGLHLDFDVVVLATGYENQQEGIRRLLGDEVADRVGPIWGFDENYVMRNMWQRTGQDGFWVMGGSLIDCRLYSRFLALQIRAELSNLPTPASAENAHVY